MNLRKRRVLLCWLHSIIIEERYPKYYKLDLLSVVHPVHQHAWDFVNVRQLVCRTTRRFGKLDGSDNSTVQTTRLWDNSTNGQDKLMVERPTSVTVMFTLTFLYNSCDSIIYRYYLSIIIYHKKVCCPSEAILAETSVSDYLKTLCKKQTMTVV